MSDNFNKVLHDFAENGEEAKIRVFAKIQREIDCPKERKFRFRYAVLASAAIAATLLCFNYNTALSAVGGFIESLTVNEKISINEIEGSELYYINENFSELHDESSIEYQIFNAPVETAGYIYLHYYRGYLKLIQIDQSVKNIDEISRWLRNNAGITVLAADTAEKADKLMKALEEGEKSIPYKNVKKTLGKGCKLPSILPADYDGRKLVQYTQALGNVNITYSLKGGGMYIEEGVKHQKMRYVSLGIISPESAYKDRLVSNLAVAERVSETAVNGLNVYFADGYYVWEDDGFTYILYSADITNEECISIISGMKE